MQGPERYGDTARLHHTSLIHSSIASIWATIDDILEGLSKDLKCCHSTSQPQAHRNKVPHTSSSKTDYEEESVRETRFPFVTNVVVSMPTPVSLKSSR